LLAVPDWKRTENGLPEKTGMKEQAEGAVWAFATMFQAQVWVV
jgi:hypothetical protein